MGKTFQSSSTDGIAWAFSPAEVAHSSICMNYGDDGFSSAEENQTQITCRTAGVFGGLSVTIQLNTFSTANLVVRFRKNGANGNQVVTIGPGATGVFSDTVNTDTLTSGDTYNSKATADAGGSGTTQVKAISCYFMGSGSHAVQYATTNDGSPGYVASTQYYHSLSGDIGLDTTEAYMQHKVDVPGTFRNLQVGISTNTRSSTTTVNFRVNAGTVNQTVSIGAGATGLFEDVTNTDVIVAGDDCNFGLLTGTGTGTLGIRAITVTFVNSTNQKANAYASISGGQNKSATQTINSCIGGMIANIVTTEASVQQNTNFPFVASQLKCYVSANSFSGTSTFALRKNGANGNNTVAIGAGATGLFEDTTHSDSFLGNDEINVAWTGGTSGTPGIMCWLGLLIDTGKTFNQII